MNRQITVIGVAVFIVSLIIAAVMILAISYISANNYGARIEADLVASRDNNQNILSQYYQKVNEAVQIPDLYKDDFKEVIQASMQGRYGDGGSKATFQWLKEHDIKIDTAMYTKVQQIIEGGRKDYELGQTRMLDIRKGYEAQQNFFWRGLWLRIAGYPKVNMADFKPVITNEVSAVYTTLREEKLQFGK